MLTINKEFFKKNIAKYDADLKSINIDLNNQNINMWIPKKESFFIKLELESAIRNFKKLLDSGGYLENELNRMDKDINKIINQLNNIISDAKIKQKTFLDIEKFGR